MKAWAFIIILSALSLGCQIRLPGRGIHSWVVLLEQDRRYDAVLVMGSTGGAGEAGLTAVHIPYRHIARFLAPQKDVTSTTDLQLRRLMEEIFGIRPDQVCFTDSDRSASFIRVLKGLEGFDGAVYLEYGRESSAFWRLLASQASVLAGDDVFPYVADLADTSRVSRSDLHQALKIIASFGGRVTVIQAAAGEGEPSSLEAAFVREQIRQAVSMLR